MGIFNFRKSDKKESTRAGSVVVEGQVNQLARELDRVDFIPTFVCAYVSLHVDIEQVARVLTGKFSGVQMTICSTAGELNATSDSFYCNTGSRWDRVVVQCFDASVIEKAEVVSVPLGCEDLRRGKIEMRLEDRIKAIRKSINSLRVDAHRSQGYHRLRPIWRAVRFGVFFHGGPVRLRALQTESVSNLSSLLQVIEESSGRTTETANHTRGIADKLRIMTSLQGG